MYIGLEVQTLYSTYEETLVLAHMKCVKNLITIRNIPCPILDKEWLSIVCMCQHESSLLQQLLIYEIP